MKILLLSVVALMSFSALANDISQLHRALCSSQEARSQMGLNGSCRIVVAVSKAQPAEGTCTGKFRGTMPCTADFLIDARGAMVHLVCGFDLSNPALDQSMKVELSAYKIAAVLTRSDESQTIINDQREHSILESGMMSIMLSKYGTSTTASIILNLKTGPEELSQVECM